MPRAARRLLGQGIFKRGDESRQRFGQFRQLCERGLGGGAVAGDFFGPAGGDQLVKRPFFEIRHGVEPGLEGRVNCRVGLGKVFDGVGIVDAVIELQGIGPRYPPAVN